MEPRIKYVSQDIICSKWATLDEDTQAKVETILHSAELPVLARHTSEKKKVEAQRALGSLTRT